MLLCSIVCILSLRNGLWDKEANTAVSLENNVGVISKDLSPFQLIFGKDFGEMCIMSNHDDFHQTKLANQGTV